MAAATPQGRWVFLVVLFCIPNLASAATGWSGQRLTGAPYYWGWPVEDKSFLTYEEAVAWTLANSPDPLMLYKEMTINGKRHVLFSQPSQYSPSVLDPNAGEPRYCNNWQTGMPASGIAPFGHVMYGPDGTFPAHIVTFNNCIQPTNIYWRIVSAPVMDVHEVEMCGVPPLKDYSPDKPPLDTVNLTPRAKEALGCLEACCGQSRTSFLSSAYRTHAYQEHLGEIWDKWKKLKTNLDPLCATLKAQVKKEFDDHGLGASKIRPSRSSCHTGSVQQPIGGCFDVHSSFTETVDFCSIQCKIYRPWPALPEPRRSDPVHVVPY